MTPEEFVSSVRHEVVESYLRTYQEKMESAIAGDEIREPYWPETARFYQSLTDEQRKQFVRAIRQTMVDTLSFVFGILDGSTLLEKHRDYFHLTYGDETQELNGELQDLFLSPET
jgi:hypothetical protein